MNARLAAYADEIERLLRFPGALDREEDRDDDVRSASGRRETADFQAMGLYDKANAPAKAANTNPAAQKGNTSTRPSSMPVGANSASAPAVGGPGAAGTGNAADAPAQAASAPVASSRADTDAIAIYSAIMGAFKREEEELRRRGGGGRRAEMPDAVNRQRAEQESRADASRAASLAGAQAAVFKVLSSAPTQRRASALLSYIGTRENEAGEKRDIEIVTDDGTVLANAADRQAFLEDFASTFEAPLQNTNFIEVRFQIEGEVSDEALAEGLNTAFGSKPFIFARDGQTVNVFAHTEDRAGALAKILAGGRENSRSKALDKIEARLREGMASAGVEARAQVTGAVGNESKAQYFLQKFIRTHRDVRRPSGEAVAGTKQPAKAAKAVYEQWRPQLAGRERRNAYHLLFSAKAGTDAKAVMSAARAVLEDLAPGHRFVLAHHAETKHVHIHAMVQARSDEGDRLKFYKADLVKWREAFAEKARERGIAMVATKRFDHVATRPFTKEHAGAYNRAKSDPRYRVNRETVQRVEAKKAKEIDRELLVANGAAIGGAWQRTATMMRAAGISGPVLAAADTLATSMNERGQGADSRVVPIDHGAAEKQRDSLQPRPGMRELQAMIGEAEMAQTPLEMRRQMARVNHAFEDMSDTLPENQQAQFEQFREDVNDKMHDGLAGLLFVA